MPSFYKNIYGYFDFEGLYESIAKYFKQGTFVEIGTWLGKSTCFMSELIKEENLPIKFYGVDTFLGEINATDQQDIVKKEGGSIYKAFLHNMKNAGVLNQVTPLQMTSKDAAELFEDGSLEFVFLDAEHVYEDVLDDLKTWWPKVKPGGIIAGHDFNGEGVYKAVMEFFPSSPIDVAGICFLVQKDEKV